jgi:hypothetical protein
MLNVLRMSDVSMVDAKREKMSVYWIMTVLTPLKSARSSSALAPMVRAQTSMIAQTAQRVSAAAVLSRLPAIIIDSVDKRAFPS